MVLGSIIFSLGNRLRAFSFTRLYFIAGFLLPFIAIGCVCVEAQRVPELKDGAKISVIGTMTLEHLGNRSFLTIKTQQPFLAIFDEPTDRRTVDEIGISLSGRDRTLRKYVGREVTVTGTIQLEPVSPYYFNGTLIIASSVQLASGSILLPAPQRTSTAPKITLPRYHALATFSPRSGNFRYKIWDDDGHAVLKAQRYLSCSLNGPGDVMNCFCADGFVASGLGGMQGNRFVMLEKPNGDFAQFEIPENLHGSVSKAVECSKPTHR